MSLIRKEELMKYINEHIQESDENRKYVYKKMRSLGDNWDFYEIDEMKLVCQRSSFLSIKLTEILIFISKMETTGIE